MNREGERLAAKFHPGNVQGAEGWEEVLLPGVGRQHGMGKEAAFRDDAAFAILEMYGGLEEWGAKYAIRLPASDSLEREIAELLPRPVGRPSKKPLAKYKEFLHQPASWKTVRRVVVNIELHVGGAFPASGFHHDQPDAAEPGGGAVPQ